MRRTERLFQIIQILRAAKGPVTGHALAEEMEVSLRTLYRDIAELIAQRVPVRGEAGTGYVLDQGYDMPPLMLTAEELEAAVLGAAWVARRGDPQLARGARDLIAKLQAVIPSDLRPIILDAGLKPISFAPVTRDGVDAAQLRHAVRDRHKVSIEYEDANGAITTRVIWPIFIAYMEEVRIIVSWCEHRKAFRHFRTDRVRRLTTLAERYPTRRSVLLKSWKETIAAEGGTHKMAAHQDGIGA
jgi:predicted DNA-binding transcriptional regulator YafY